MKSHKKHTKYFAALTSPQLAHSLKINLLRNFALNCPKGVFHAMQKYVFFFMAESFVTWMTTEANLWTWKSSQKGYMILV